MILYRILTENKNKDKIVDLATCYFESFTMLKAQGYWQGQPENSLIIEIVLPKISLAPYTLASRIKNLNYQQCVMVQAINIESQLI